MLQEKGSIWRVKGDALCIPTNGATRKDGCAVMGRGLALSARKKWPDLPKQLGALLREHGNRVHLLPPKHGNMLVFSFPSKPTGDPWPGTPGWQMDSSVLIIERSCEQLIRMADLYHLKRVLLPRAGCGNGNLNWYLDVKPAFLDHFMNDDRFVVITPVRSQPRYGPY
jgi:hypothetical protein